MTCHEFERAASSFSLFELARTQDQLLVGHANDCRQCDAWLQKQRMLAASLQTLQARTAGLEASHRVEAELLRKFRQAPTEVAQPTNVIRFPSAAMQFSRLFEIGAYAAVAAAVVVALALGAGLWRYRSPSETVQSQPKSPIVVAATPMTISATNDSTGKITLPPREVSARRASAVKRLPAAGITEDETAMSDSQANSEQDYMALMLCDPLSCASDAQLVRMELPPSPAEGRDSPQLADVVVGYDGVVRAVRIVN